MGKVFDEQTGTMVDYEPEGLMTFKKKIKSDPFKGKRGLRGREKYFTYEEIAGVLEITVPAVKQLVYRNVIQTEGAAGLRSIIMYYIRKNKVEVARELIVL